MPRIRAFLPRPTRSSTSSWWRGPNCPCLPTTRRWAGCVRCPAAVLLCPALRACHLRQAQRPSRLLQPPHRISQLRLRLLQALLQHRQPRPSPLHQRPLQLLRLSLQLRLRQLHLSQSSVNYPASPLCRESTAWHGGGLVSLRENTERLDEGSAETTRADRRAAG